MTSKFIHQLNAIFITKYNIRIRRYKNVEIRFIFMRNLQFVNMNANVKYFLEFKMF